MLVAQCMTRSPVVITAETALPVAIAHMTAHRVHHLPVVNAEGRLVGIVTDRDCRRAFQAPVLPIDDPRARLVPTDLTVGEVMTEQVITVTPGATLLEAAQLMRDHDISCLPVVLDGALVGIITKTDLFHAFLELLETRGARLFWDY